MYFQFRNLFSHSHGSRLFQQLKGCRTARRVRSAVIVVVVDAAAIKRYFYRASEEVSVN